MATGQQSPQQNTFDGPPYDADWQIDASQSATELADRHGRNAQNPAAHQVYRKQLEDKEREFGVIHVDPATGYRARFKPQGGSAPPDRGDPATGVSRDAGDRPADEDRVARLRRELAEAEAGRGGT